MGRFWVAPTGKVSHMPDLSLLPPSARIDGEDLQVGGCSLPEMAVSSGRPPT